MKILNPVIVGKYRAPKAIEIAELMLNLSKGKKSSSFIEYAWEKKGDKSPF